MIETRRYKGLRYRDRHAEEVQDDVSIEVPLSIAVNHIPFTVTMQTPGNEFDLARGLLLTEDLLPGHTIKPEMEILSRNTEGYIDSINLVIPEKYVSHDALGNRNLISASSCGICGKTSLEGFTGAPLDHHSSMDATQVGNLFKTIDSKQLHFRKTGGTHAAGIFTTEGETLSVREDIGRHNAVDKVIGDLLNRGILSQAKVLTVSGRISFEIVSKAHKAGIPFVASVSAPSSMAIDHASAAGITLLAFCRNGNFTAYSHPGNIRVKQTVV